MDEVTSFRASAVSRDELNGIMTDYLALERVRIVRRLLVARFGLLALAAAAAGVWPHWLSPFASSFSVAVCLTPPTWAWVLECQRSRRLSRRLEEVPGAVTHGVVSPARRKKVVKTS